MAGESLFTVLVLGPEIAGTTRGEVVILERELEEEGMFEGREGVGGRVSPQEIVGVCLPLREDATRR